MARRTAGHARTAQQLAEREQWRRLGHDRLRGFGRLLDDGFASGSAKLWSGLGGGSRRLDRHLDPFADQAFFQAPAIQVEKEQVGVSVMVEFPAILVEANPMEGCITIVTQKVAIEVPEDGH